jgi:hypothetical protein
LGDEHWRDQVTINYLTPYWIAYGSWLLASLFLPVSVAFKVVLSLFFLFYVGAFVQMRREFMAPALLDWILVPSFFGFCYEWGFVTFMFAAPVGVVFFLLNKRWQETQKSKWAWAVLAAGMILYFSHLLMFLFFCFLTPVYLLVCCRFRLAVWRRFLPPYLLFAALLGVYLSRPDPLAPLYPIPPYAWGNLFDHLLGWVIWQWRMSDILFSLSGISFSLLTMLSVMALVVPFILGYELKHDIRFYIPLLCLLIVFLSVPNTAFEAYYICDRFSMLFFPFYILCFTERPPNKTAQEYFPRIGMAWGGFIIFCLLYAPLTDLWHFHKEVRGFASLLDELPAQQRALILVTWPNSRVIDNPTVYMFFPAWYQAEKGGWVDINYAWYSPQAVRYRPDRVPAMKPNFGGSSTPSDCERYELIFVRAIRPPSDNMFQNTPCQRHALYKSQGDWYVYHLPDANPG